jgi:outer membrane immunogenic protein
VKARLLGSVALPILIAGPAMAADLPVKAPAAPVAVAAAPSWTGFYVGLNAGGAWTQSDPNTPLPCATSNAVFCNVNNPPTTNGPVVAAAGTVSISAGVFTGGVQAGYNLQSDNAVYGIELDFNSLHLRGTRQATGTYVATIDVVHAGQAFTITSSVNTDWLFTARGRVGAVFGAWLAYATGGLALTNLSLNNSFTDAQSSFGNWSNSQTKLGWTAGGGLEWKLAQNWTAKVEYLFVKFGSITASGAVINNSGIGYANAISTSSDLTAHIARAGINYKF